MNLSSILRRRAVLLLSLILLAGLYSVARPHTPPMRDQSAGERFQFTRFDLPEPEGMVNGPHALHPSMERISAWVHWAAAALGDLDADGLPNDICHVSLSRQGQCFPCSAPAAASRASSSTTPLPYDQTMAPMAA
jgi:hypothetical protein